MLKYRLITGPILIATLLAVMWLDQRLTGMSLTGAAADLFPGREHPPAGMVLFLLASLAVLLGGIELASIIRGHGVRASSPLTAIAALAGLWASFLVPASMPAGTALAVAGTVIVAVFVVSLITYSAGQNVEGVLAATGGMLLAMVYLGLLMGFLLDIRVQHDAWVLVAVVLVTKSGDTGAYFTGRAIGRHKLIPWLSPGKTWEGLFGGIALAMVVGALLAWAGQHLYDDPRRYPIGLGLVAGAIFLIVGQAGDLTMSLLKRGAGVKDSSTLLPGLGGILDVLDSPLLVAPVAWWLLRSAG